MGTGHRNMVTGRYPADEGRVNTFAVASRNPEHPGQCRPGGSAGRSLHRPQMPARYPRRLAVVSQPRPVAVIVLAAGEGTRMRSRIPKVLHALCGRSMLGHALAAAGGLDPQRLVVVAGHGREAVSAEAARHAPDVRRSEEHTSELQSRRDLVCRLLLEKKKKNKKYKDRSKEEINKKK